MLLGAGVLGLLVVSVAVRARHNQGRGRVWLLLGMIVAA